MKRSNKTQVLLLLLPLLLTVVFLVVIDVLLGAFRGAVVHGDGSTTELYKVIFVCVFSCCFFVLPLYLPIVSYQISVKRNFSFALSLVISIISLYGGIVLQYLSQIWYEMFPHGGWNWVINREAAAFLLLETIVVTVIFFTGFFCVFLLYYRKRNKPELTG